MKNKTTTGQLYAVTKGTLTGTTIVLMETRPKSIEFLCLTTMQNMTISASDVKQGVENDILELLETLPEDIMITCEEQYRKNLNTG